MKYLMILIMVATSVAFAEDNCSVSRSATEVEETQEIKTDVPKFLEGATITVTLKDGKTSTVPAEKFKVVARKQQFLVKRTKQTDSLICQEEPKRHRVSVLVGAGNKDGLDRDDNYAPNTIQVKSRIGPNAGLQYQYKSDIKIFNKPLSFGVQGVSNKSGAGLLGIDF